MRHWSRSLNFEPAQFRVEFPRHIRFVACRAASTAICCRLDIAHPRDPEKEREKEKNAMCAAYHVCVLNQNSAQRYYFFITSARKMHKKSAEAPFLLLAEEDRSDEGRELLMGFGALEVFFPSLIEFHETRMGLVAKDDLGIATGLLPNAALLGFSGG